MWQRLAGQPRRLLLVALTGLVGILALVNVLIARAPVDVSPAVPYKSSGVGISPVGPGALKTPLDGKLPASFPETVTRPIFNANRKPTEREQPRAAPLAGPDDLRLMGILQTTSGTKRALIRPGLEGKGVWVVEGEQVSGWTLKSIGQRSVVVANGGRTYEIAIHKGAAR